MSRGWMMAAGAAWVAFLSSFAHGDDASLLASARVELQVVSVSTDDARSLVPELLDAKTVQKGFDRVQALIAQEKATLIGYSIQWSNIMQRGVSETHEVILSRTEPIPPSPPGGTVNHGPTYRAEWGPQIPVAMEGRNAGIAFEVEATSIDAAGRTIELNLFARHVRLVRFDDHYTQASPLGGVGIISVPNFQASNIQTTLAVVHDRPVLLGNFVVPDPQPHVELFLLRTRATRLPATTKFPAPSKE